MTLHAKSLEEYFRQRSQVVANGDGDDDVDDDGVAVRVIVFGLMKCVLMGSSNC